MADAAFTHGMSRHSTLVRVEAGMYKSAFHGQCREYDICERINEECTALATEYDFPVGKALGDMRLGWLRGCGGDATGIPQLRAGIEAWRAGGSAVAAPAFLGLLAEACVGACLPEEGIEVAREAIRYSQETGAAHNDAELHRSLGELLLLSGDDGDAEASLEQAIDCAREQQAKAWELRATISLCGLWQKQGKGSEARARLAELCSWFTDGRGAPELEEAKELLATLA
jgi:predicted ATPase